MKYRNKPVIVEAVKWTGSNLEEVKKFVGDSFDEILDGKHICVKTGEGLMGVTIGDYIVKSSKGGFYPCDPDEFEAFYEEIGEDCTLTKKCFKENNNYSMYIKCEVTGKEINCDSYYWNDFNFCPCCGQCLVEREG